MSLKPQDVIVLLKLALSEGHPWTFATLGQSLGMSASEVHNAVKRSRAAGLLGQDWNPDTEGLLEFLIHGVRYAFAPERGGITRGIPTAHGAPPLSQLVSAGELPPVWPDPTGNVRGEALRPLHRSAPTAASGDRHLYECLALVDAIRAGRARERSMAAARLRAKLESGRGSKAP